MNSAPIEAIGGLTSRMRRNGERRSELDMESELDEKRVMEASSDVGRGWTGRRSAGDGGGSGRVTTPAGDGAPLARSASNLRHRRRRTQSPTKQARGCSHFFQ